MTELKNYEKKTLSDDRWDEVVREISLFHVASLLKKFYKTILFFGLVGLIFDLGFLIIMPKKYEAIMRVSVAHMPNKNILTGARSLNLEEPANLIVRMSSTTLDTANLSNACKLRNESDLAKFLRSVDYNVIKGSNNFIEIRLTRSSPVVAQDCANSLYEALKFLQNKLKDVEISSAIIQLENAKLKLSELEKLLKHKPDKQAIEREVLGDIILFNEYNYFSRESYELINYINSAKVSEANLIAPIYINQLGSAALIYIELIFSFFCGVLLGLLFLLYKKKREKI
jgi:hypothetical protein